ncbi:hypothetical protein HGA64_02105 [Candidatus Falkowbacteria bacterium]|nr:hypothetical protein [Candidatus Falkowbacteria bacterium]
MVNDWKIFRWSIFALFAVEFTSFCGWLTPAINKGVFLLLIAIALVASIKRLEFGLWLVLIELFIGSKGYLFWYEIGTNRLSIRIGLWLVVMLVWAVGTLFKLSKTRSLSYWRSKIKSKNLLPPFLLLCAFVLFGAVNGLLHHVRIKDIFLDANAWFYLALLGPAYTVFASEGVMRRFWQVFWAATTWLAIKTIFLLFIFSHEQTTMIVLLYRWVRDTGIGEITQIQGGFYRIFIQSQVFNLLALLFAVATLRDALKTKSLSLKDAVASQKFRAAFWFFTINLVVTLLSFSRSFWVALLAVSPFYLWWMAKGAGELKIKLLTLSRLAIFGACSAAVAAFIIYSSIAFPYPRPLGGFSAAGLFSSRATNTNESAIGSRWALLPKLWQSITESPILGKGFGASVTYISKDPRVLEKNPKGEYTTSAFEWAWLDIWLKIGILGLLSYLYLLYRIGFEDWSKGAAHVDYPPAGLLSLGLILLSVMHVFTPYLNHPLGLGYLVIAIAIIDARHLKVSE